MSCSNGPDPASAANANANTMRWVGVGLLGLGGLLALNGALSTCGASIRDIGDGVSVSTSKCWGRAAVGGGHCRCRAIRDDSMKLRSLAEHLIPGVESAAPPTRRRRLAGCGHRAGVSPPECRDAERVQSDGGTGMRTIWGVVAASVLASAVPRRG